MTAKPTMETLGNEKLLQKQTIAFLAPSKVRPLAVLPTLEWAAEISSREDVLVLSGWNSKMEREVLKILLSGSCGIGLFLARKMYSIVPELWQNVLKQGRLLILSDSTELRQSRRSAALRNERLFSLCDSGFLPCVPPEDSSLYPLFLSQRESITLLYHSSPDVEHFL